MNWEVPPRPYLSSQLPTEGISSRAVNMDPKPISSLPQGPSQGSPILDEERINSRPSNVPTYSRNHQVDTEPEARSLVDYGASSPLYRLTRTSRRTPLAFIHHHSLLFGPSMRELGRPTLGTLSLASMTLAFLLLAHVFRTRSPCAR